MTSSQPTPQDSELEELLNELIYDTDNQYGWPPDFEPDFNKTKTALKQALYTALVEQAKPVLYVASEKDRKVYSEKPELAIPLSVLSSVLGIHETH